MNGMEAQIHSLPDLIRSVAGEYDQAVRQGLPLSLCRNVQRIYLAGCGDSHHASLGAEMAFEHLAGIPTKALTALQYSRYAADRMPAGEAGSNLLVVASVSGEVSRTLEAVLCGRRYGATAVALTAAPNSRIGQAADFVIDTTQPPFQDPPGMVIPGSRSYVANQVGLLLLAVQIGEGRGHLSPAEAAGLRQEIRALGDAAEQTLLACAGPARELAAEWHSAGDFVFVGGGPSYASALFCAAKVLEASGDSALGQDTEEWAHLQYFARTVDTPTFFISAGERDLSRLVEVTAAARAVGRRVGLVAPRAAAAAAANAMAWLALPGGVREMFSPLISAIPGSLFAAARAEVIGESFFRSFGGGRSPEGGGGISRIRTSEIHCPDELA